VRKKMDNNLILNGELLALSSNDEGDLIAKFLICPLDELNLNGVGLRESDLSEDELLGLATRPVQCKVIDKNGTLDFGSHEAKITYIKDENGNLVKKYVFDTQSVGYHTDVSIEDIDINSITKRCIVAVACIWSRYENVISVVNRLAESLHTSWEIAYSEYYMDNGGKWIKGLKWLGNCLLGSNVLPAYGDAGLLEVAEEDQEIQLSNAIIEDNNKINQENINDNEGGQEMSQENNKNKKVDLSSLTTRDISSKVRDAIWESDEFGWAYDIMVTYPLENRVLIYKYDALDEDFIEVTYSIDENDGTVVLNEGTPVKMVFIPQSDFDTQIAQLTEAKQKATKELASIKADIKTKETEVAELQNKLNEKETELSAKISSIVDLGKNISEKETVIAEKEELLQAKETEIAELLPFKAQVEEINAEKTALEIAEKKEAFKNEYLSTKLISEKDLEIAEVKEAIETMDNSKMEIFIAQKVIANAKAGKPQSEIEVSEVKEPKIEVNLSSANNDNKEFNFADCWK
jgi:hypothetical protein